MIEINVSDIIQKTRLELKITQAQLCKGICSVSMLSKIENGERYPTEILFSTLMERMGKSGKLYNIIGINSEVKISKYRNDILKYLINEDIFNAQKSINLFEHEIAKNDRLNMQFLYYVKACISSDSNERLNFGIAAIKYTIKDFSINTVSNYLLSNLEILIINLIACTYKDIKQYSKAITYFKILIQYIEIHISDVAEKMRTYPLITLNLSNSYVMTKNYMEAIAISNKGISTCKSMNNLQLISYFCYNKAISLAHLNIIDEANEMILYSYFTLKNNNDSMAEILKSDFEQVTGKKLIVKQLNHQNLTNKI